MLSQPLLERLRSIDLFLLDLDGTVYLDNDPIPGAIDFIAGLAQRGIGYIFLTNNSSKSADDYLRKLNRLGFITNADQVITSGQVTAWYLAEKKPEATLFVAGTETLKTELASCGLRIIDDPGADVVDYVVAGFDTELTYRKIRIACGQLSAGAGFVATNPDLVCPMGAGKYLPDCGSICAMLKNATGREPVYIGKPHTTMINYLRDRRTVTPRTTAMVGDRLYTDIALGCNASILSICVLSGESDRAAVAKSPFKPDITLESVADLHRLLA
jgi:NagD protein